MDEVRGIVADAIERAGSQGYWKGRACAAHEVIVLIENGADMRAIRAALDVMIEAAEAAQ